MKSKLDRILYTSAYGDVWRNTPVNNTFKPYDNSNFQI